MLQRILALAQKEFIQIRRDRRTLAMMVVLPILWLVLFGYAFSFDVQEVAVALVDESGTATGATIAAAIREYDRFVLVDLAEPSEAGIREAIFRGEAAMGILIPPGYGDEEEAQLQVLLDGASLFAAQTAARLLPSALEPAQEELRDELITRTRAEVEAQIQELTEARKAELLDRVPPLLRPQVEQMLAAGPGIDLDQLEIAAPSPLQLTPVVTTLYNPDLKTATVMIPGLLGLVVMFMTTLMTALGVVREREYGTMEQLVVTPIRPLELMLGKLLPYLVVGAVDFALVFAAGLYLFDLSFAGNLWLFILLCLLLVLTTLSLGLLISTVSQNQQQAMQLSMFTLMPQILLSGLIFPLDSMPKVIQFIAYLMPFTHFVPIAQGMFIKGQGLDLLWPQAVVLAGYAVVVVALATVRFQKRLA
ncbi:ABC-2 type transport system permease protein [Symbiobacterium terraclitae]|uniref:Transport permease protein n=1 Tax=Symbiobacterium terraclitae TaxID=557451 RepID=A0ABS4JT41_9FIRM|nr:ABC transporter permease [Symbiobacterium terraclitae]MBP2018682.1 ABC-2 type transport system permease protein [Symbiobacterium terraclitae]